MAETKTCVVTGGAGFIGSHLCEALLAANYQVVAVDNFITGRKENLNDAFKHPQFRLVEQDVIEPLNKLTIQQSDKVTHIFHLASPASVVDYQKYPEETALVNSVGTLNLLRLAKDSGARFLLASTSEIYGDPKEHPQKESYWGNVNPIGPRACYDESKRFAEMVTTVYARKYHLDARIVRIFNTYGPRMRKNDGRVISNFVHQALERKPLTVYGNGTQTRSFCYVADLIEGLIRLMFTDGLSGEVVNLGNPEEYSVIDLAKKIKEMTGSSSEIVFTDLPQDDPKERQPDITKAKTLLGWEPKIPVSEGLSKTIEYYQTLRNA